MKLSDAIKELQKAIDKHGDIELCDHYNGEFNAIDELCVFRDNDKKVAVFIF